MKKTSLKNIYVADFETTTQEDDCRVWAWGLADIEKENFIYDNDIDSFIEYLREFNHTSLIYFHNLKFDIQFILYYLLKNGYEYSNKKAENCFSTIISDMLIFYQLKLYIKNKKGNLIEIKFQDSHKKISMPVKAMPKAFGLEGITKGNLDDSEEEGYNAFREKGHILTDFEVDYLRRDVIIVCRCLKIQYNQGLTKMTSASDALASFKSIIGERIYKNLFPVLDLETDNDIRKSYRGGWVYCVKHQKVDDGIVFDVNSLYPSALYSVISNEKHPYPFGIPEYFRGKYKEDKEYNLYIQHIRVNFEMKDGFLPFIQLSHFGRFGSAHYEKSTNDEMIDLYLTSVDLELFYKHYNIKQIIYVDGYKFMSVLGLFDEYIDKYMKMKIENNDNKPLRQIAKLFLNSLYGKFGTSKIVRSKIPYYDSEEDKVMYKLETFKNEDGEEVDYKIEDGLRVDVASFCTAYARRVTISAAQKAHTDNRFCYADTDSIHLTGVDIPEYIEVDDVKLGFWKHESTFKKAIFIRSKTYAEYINISDSKYAWDIKCCGMTPAIKDFIKNRDDFEELFNFGFNTQDERFIKRDEEGMVKYDKDGNIAYEIPQRLKPKVLTGGCILINTPFQIKEN